MKDHITSSLKFNRYLPSLKPCNTSMKTQTSQGSVFTLSVPLCASVYLSCSHSSHQLTSLLRNAHFTQSPRSLHLFLPRSWPKLSQVWVNWITPGRNLALDLHYPSGQMYWRCAYLTIRLGTQTQKCNGVSHVTIYLFWLRAASRQI